MSHKYNKGIAAAKSGMNSKTARKYLLSNEIPDKTVKSRHWKTRSNVFEGDWLVIEDMLSKSPGLQAKTILSYLISKTYAMFYDK